MSTSISGSGPAYIFMLMEAMIEYVWVFPGFLIACGFTTNKRFFFHDIDACVHGFLVVLYTKKCGSSYGFQS